VTGEKHRRPLRGRLADDILQCSDSVGVETGRGFVQYQQAGIAYQRHRHPEALFHPLRVVPDRALGVALIEAHTVQ